MKLELHSETTLPLWEIAHTTESLRSAEAENYTSYLLNYEGEEEAQDPSKAAYKHFSDKTFPEGNVTDEFDYNPYHTGFTSTKGISPPILCADFNRTPHCWALMQLQHGLYIVFHELKNDDALTREQTEDMAEILHELKIDRVLLAGDNTSNQGAGRYGRKGKSDWDDVRKYLKANDISYDDRLLGVSNPKRKVRVDEVNNVIYSGIDEEGSERRRLIIHPRCEWTIEDYKYSLTDDDGVKSDDQGERGHMSDAIDYPIYKLEKGTTHIIYVM